MEAFTVFACNTGSAPYAGSSSTVRSVNTNPGTGNSRNSTEVRRTGLPSDSDIKWVIRFLKRFMLTSGGTIATTARTTNTASAPHSRQRLFFEPRKSSTMVVSIISDSGQLSVFSCQLSVFSGQSF